MTALANFRHMAKGGESREQVHANLPDTTNNTPGVSATTLFAFQSYFDDTLLQQALLQQSKNEPIVNSVKPALGVATPMVKTNVGGYAIGLHPSSQTPVAVLPLVGGQTSSPQPIILKPGQVYRPQGRPGNKPGHFSAVNWGIPFGWLGGGVATLYIFSSPDADVDWSGNPEIIFHRQRMKIVAPADLGVTVANAPKNWPLRFPWTQAVRGADNVDQKGQAIIGVEPTRVLMTLRLGNLAAASRMRILAQESNDFGLSSSGGLIAAETVFQDYVWGAYTVNGGGGNLGTNYPVVEPSGPWYRLAADDGGIQLIDMSGGALANAYVDVVRYGRL